MHKSVKNIRCENAGEMVNDGPHSQECAKRLHETGITALRLAIDEGDVGNVAKGDVFRRIRARLNLPRQPR